jgi:stress-induced morphogen
MPVTAAEIETRIRDALPDARVAVADATGGGDHWSARVVADAFRGKPLVERHRMVYAALGELMRHEIHALALVTETPEEGGRT